VIYRGIRRCPNDQVASAPRPTMVAFCERIGAEAIVARRAAPKAMPR